MMKHIDYRLEYIDGHHINYRTDTDFLRNPTAVFVHGAGGSQAVWSHQFEVFSKIIPCIYVDLPGHGNSDGTSFSIIEDYSASLAKLFDKLEISQPLLVGHSMGSAIAMQMTLEGINPLGLVLVGSGARLRVSPTILELINTNFAHATDLISRNLFSTSKLDDYFKRIEKDIIVCGQTGLLDDFTACDNFDVMDQLHNIHCPTLVIVGNNDVMTPPKYAYYLSKNIPHCGCSVIDQAGHMVMAEKPESFNSRVLSFIESCLTSE